MNLITIHRKGQAEPEPRPCPDQPHLFLCPFCSKDSYKPTQYHQIMTHLASHKLRAVKHGEYLIYGCHLGCGGRSRHFHCCQCPLSYVNKSALLKHLRVHPVEELEVSLMQSAAPTATISAERQLLLNTESLQEKELASTGKREVIEQGASQKNDFSLQSPRMTTEPDKHNEIEHIEGKHITIHQKGQAEPEPRRCPDQPHLFLCPFCTKDSYKPTQYHQIMTHLASHKLRAVKHGEYLIYGCSLGCGGRSRHFHCCQCPLSYVNKSALLKHLRVHPVDTSIECPSVPEPPPSEPEPLPSGPQLPPSEPQLPTSEPPPAGAVLHIFTVEKSTQICSHSPSKRKQIYVLCPHCNLRLNRKNVKMHIRRKHTEEHRSPVLKS